MPHANPDPAARPDLRALRRRPLFAPLAVPALLLGAVLAAGALLWTLQDTTTVIVVRHAEKIADGTKDPALAPEGVARAARYAARYGGAGLTAVYATPFKRTRDTAAPVAAAAGVAVTETDPKDAAALAERIVEEHRGDTVFVVGHSNTIGPIVQALGGEAPTEIADTAYDDVFIVTAPRFGPVSTLHLREP
jgi:broad specificity phosphatase PhoE